MSPSHTIHKHSIKRARIGDVPSLTIKNETQPTNCPLCGKYMTMIKDLKDFSIQNCHTHGVFAVDKPTNDTWAIEGFNNNMTPIKHKWYTIDNYKPLTLDQYRDMVKKANLKRLEEKSTTHP